MRPQHIRTFGLLVGLVAVLGMASDAAAQETVDVSRLPLNLDRIQRELRQPAIREERQGLNLRYVVNVYGQAPPIMFFGPEANLVQGDCRLLSPCPASTKDAPSSSPRAAPWTSPPELGQRRWPGGIAPRPRLRFVMTPRAIASP